jgi:hypothetical protein
MSTATLVHLPIFIVGMGQFRMILKIILKKKAKSAKLQAASNA